VLLLFNYYLFYEYGVLSRNYALGILCLFSFCALGPLRRKHPPCAAFLLFLLMQTSFHGLVIGLLFSGMLIYECWGEEKDGRLRRVLLPIVIIATGVIVCLAVMVPPPDCGIYTGGHASLEWRRLLKVAALPFKSILPFPWPARSFWNTNILDPWRPVQAALSLVLLAWLILALLRRRILALLLLSSSIVYMLFHYLKFYGYIRHHGHIFIVLLACLWLVPNVVERRLKLAWLDRLSGMAFRSLSYLLTGIFVLGAAAGIYAARKDWKYPFTDSPAAAQFLRASGLSEMSLAGDVDDACLAFPILLDKRIYYPRSDTDGTFVTYDRSKRWRKMRYWEILGRIGLRAARQKDGLVLVLNYDIPSQILDPWQEDHPEGVPGHLNPLAVFSDGIVNDEHYRIFLVEGKGRSDPPQRHEDTELKANEK